MFFKQQTNICMKPLQKKITKILYLKLAWCGSTSLLVKVGDEDFNISATDNRNKDCFWKDKIVLLLLQVTSEYRALNSQREAWLGFVSVENC